MLVLTDDFDGAVVRICNFLKFAGTAMTDNVFSVNGFYDGNDDEFKILRI